jgi:hypothetical protein
MTDATIAEETERLSALSVVALRTEWRARFDGDPPAFRSRDLLMRAMLHRLQAQQFGDLRPAMKRRLSLLAVKFAAAPALDPAPRTAASIGSALVREWNGVRHVVLVTPEGFQYGEVTYPSLTQVAKAISGTHQSGPRFFGIAS